MRLVGCSKTRIHLCSGLPPAAVSQVPKQCGARSENASAPARMNIASGSEGDAARRGLTIVSLQRSDDCVGNLSRVRAAAQIRAQMLTAACDDLNCVHECACCSWFTEMLEHQACRPER